MLQRELQTIVIIEDDPSLCETLTATLLGAGYDVSAAADGDLGMDLIRRNKPQIVLTDLYLPGNDGMEILKDLRKESPQIGVIAMSGGDGTETLLKMATKLGARATLSKPFSIPELLRAVELAVQPRILKKSGKNCPH